MALEAFMGHYGCGWLSRRASRHNAANESTGAWNQAEADRLDKEIKRITA